MNNLKIASNRRFARNIRIALEAVKIPSRDRKVFVALAKQAVDNHNHVALDWGVTYGYMVKFVKAGYITMNKRGISLTPKGRLIAYECGNLETI